MAAEVSSLSYSLEQVISVTFDIEPTEVFKKNGYGMVQLDGAVLHMKLYQTEEGNVLLLMADLGMLPSKKQTEYYRWMLIENSGWIDIAGGALCTDESGDHALLRLQLDLNTLEAQILVQWLEAFVDAAEAWAERVSAPDSLPEASNAGGTDPRQAIPQQDFPGFLPFNLA